MFHRPVVLVVIMTKQAVHIGRDKIRMILRCAYVMSSKCSLLLINEFTLGFVFDLWIQWALVQVASHQASSPKSSRKSFRSSLKSLQASHKQVSSPKNSDSSRDSSSSLWHESPSLVHCTELLPSTNTSATYTTQPSCSLLQRLLTFSTYHNLGFIHIYSHTFILHIILPFIKLLN